MIFATALGLLGIGAALALLGVFDSSSSSTAPDEDETIEVGEEEQLVTGGGNDLITDGPDSGHPDLIDTGAGDDTVTLDDGLINALSTQVVGGDGDDMISISNGLETTVEGGAGNDVIDMTNAATVFVNGGEGDDQITFTQPFNSSDQPSTVTVQEGSRVTGGDGNDTIITQAVLDSEIGATTLEGGDGSDRFNIDVVTTDFDFLNISEELLFEYDDEGNVIGEIEIPVVRGTPIVISDFEPGVDHLNLYLDDTHATESGAHTVSGVVTEEVSEGTTIKVTVDAERPDDPEKSYQIVVSIFLQGTFNLDGERDLTLFA